MKVSILIFIAVILTSCKPEVVLNKKLNGEWALRSINGNALGDGYSEVMRFEEDKTEGDITITEITNGLAAVKKGTYSLVKSSNITVAIPNNSSEYPYDITVYDVVKSTKNDLELLRVSDSFVFIFSKN
jgi:hypothetical protein